MESERTLKLVFLALLIFFNVFLFLLLKAPCHQELAYELFQLPLLDELLKKRSLEVPCKIGSRVHRQMDGTVVFFEIIFKLRVDCIHPQSLTSNQFNQLHLVDSCSKSFIYTLDSYLSQLYIQENRHLAHLRVRLLFTLFSKTLVSFVNIQIRFINYVYVFFQFLMLMLSERLKLASSVKAQLKQPSMMVPLKMQLEGLLGL